jgi:hypothetical protein
MNSIFLNFPRFLGDFVGSLWFQNTLFSPKKLYVLESSFKALSESVKTFEDFALFHREQAAWIFDSQIRLFSVFPKFGKFNY